MKVGISLFTLCALALLFVGSTPAATAPMSTDPAGTVLLPGLSLQFDTQSLTCTVTIDCQYSADVSCSSSNNDCSTTTDPDGNECVVCDGVTGDCCEKCTEVCTSKCDTRWMICLEGCFGDPVCEDRCWTNRDTCYYGCGC